MIMKFAVMYSFGGDWYTQGVYDTKYEAKQNYKTLRKHMMDWNGKLLGKLKIKAVD